MLVDSRRPAYYEYNSLDSFEDLIQYAQGLTQFADEVTLDQNF